MSQLTTRRRFLESATLLAAGAGAATFAPSLWRASAQPAWGADAKESPENRLKALGLKLPEVTPSKNIYVPTVLTGNLLYVAGHTPGSENGKPVVGKLGADMTIEQGQHAARLVGLRILAAAREALGSLDRIERVVKTFGMVNATADFTQQPLVINGFSQLMVEVFGEANGKGTRCAVGMGSLPGGAPVEVEIVFQVRD